MWLTQYDERSPVFSNAGSKERSVYSSSFDEKGRLVLEETGKESLFDFIQSFKDSCDVSSIVKRFTEGDVSALSKVQGFYCDTTVFPKTYADMLNIVIKGEQDFYNLPVEVRERFNNDFKQYVASMDSPDFFKKLSGDMSGDSGTNSSSNGSGEGGVTE